MIHIFFFSQCLLTQLSQKWEHNVPEIMFVMIYILSGAICFAVSVMLLSYVHGIVYGETSVEGQDHAQYRRQARRRNEVQLILQCHNFSNKIFVSRSLSIHMTAGLYSWFFTPGLDTHSLAD